MAQAFVPAVSGLLPTRFLPAILAILLLAAIATRADLPAWIRYLESGSREENALFRAIDLPGGPIAVRRPAQEARAELTRLISATPTAADLYSLRAHEAESLLDFVSAEADWKKYAEQSKDKFTGLTALADYYHRRAQVPEEMRTLAEAAAQPSPASERFITAARQRSHRTFERMLTLSQRQLLPPAQERDIYQEWTARYPREASLYLKWMNVEMAGRDFDQAAQRLAEYPKRFPGDTMTVTTMTAELERARGNTDRAIAVYNSAFQPLWPRGLYNNFFSLLRDTRNARKFLADARAAAGANPLSLDPVARQFHYHLYEGHTLAAQRVLVDYRRRKEATPASWTGPELRTMAQLWNNYGNNRNETARFYYALYSRNGASDAEQEEGLSGIAHLLLAAPDQPLPLGGGDLSFYQDIATADPYPGLLNGILSLLLNSSEPASRYANQDQQASAYFQRAKAAELVDLFEKRFARSNRRADLRYYLMQAYAVHGEDDAVISSGRKFLADFPTQANRTNVSLLVADSLARRNQVQPELATYDALLTELAKRAEGMPLGEGLLEGAEKAGPRSPDYARVLDRYISRLVSLKRTNDALAMMRREIDRNPNDPGLYERLASFLAQNQIFAQQEAIYKLAISRFPDRSWSHKLARFYLGRKQQQAFQQHTTEVIKVFSGSELETYFREVVGRAGLDRVMYRQVNLYANLRFPRNLTFVENLPNVYTADGTRDPVAYENLLRRHWFYSDSLRARFFAHLSAAGKLGSEFQSLQASTANPAANPAAARLVAEAQAWWSHFEFASPVFTALAKTTPGDSSIGVRAAALERSMAAFDPRHAEESAAIEAKLMQAAPRDSAPRTRIGEISRDYPRASAGRNAWAQIPDLEPGSADKYVEAATVHWDYFEYEPALNLLALGRQRLKNDALFAYEAGAIRENQRQFPQAIQEYLKGALAQPGGSLAQSRLVTLAGRSAYRSAIDEATSKAATGDNPPLNAITLRIALLEAQSRKADLEAYLINLATATRNFETLARVGMEGRRLEFPRVEERAVSRQIELASDPLDKLELKLTLARTYEQQGNFTAAARAIDTLRAENPMILGILRAAVNYHSRNGNEARAVELLTAAAPSAHVTLRPKLELEAARRATSIGQYPRARQLLTRLLDAQPYEAAYLSAMADTYARAHDDAGLRSFHQDKIALIAQAPLSAAERMERLATMRRSLIPVLTRAREYMAAVDQYIEVLNRYPEDAQLTDEIANYARQYGQQQRLLDYYAKAAAASSRDYRFPMILARVTTKLEDHDAAIRWYAKASEIRPDRTDLLGARGDLEERLLRFDEAVATFTKVYDLTYQRSSWMERVALVRARQRKIPECITALEKALLQGRSDSPDAQLEMAQRLDQWGMTEQAQSYAERGLAKAGDEGSKANAARVHARIMTRLGRYREAYPRAPNKDTLMAMAPVVRRYFTAGQKAQFATFLDSVAADPDIGQQAGMPEWHAKRLAELLRNGSSGSMSDLIRIQRARLHFAELGAQLEEFAGKRVEGSDGAWSPAANAYRLSGDTAGELRTSAHSSQDRPRYLQLLATEAPDTLLQSAAQRLDAVNAAVASGNSSLALSAVATRGSSLTPVWTRSYTALAGMYFGLRTPEVDSAFQQALGPSIVRARLATPLDRRQQLAGDVWYSYGSRYGEYLDYLKRTEAEDYLAAMVEGMPGNAGAYVTLADYYRQSGRPALALAHYDYALQLNPRHLMALHGTAQVLLAQNQREQAKAQWRMALDSATALLGERRLPYELPAEIEKLSAAIVEHQLASDLRAEFERLAVRTIDRYNLLTLTADWKSIDVNWVLSLSRAIPEPVPLLVQLLDDERIAESQKDPVYARLLEVIAARAAQAVGDNRNQEQASYWEWQTKFLQSLLDRKQADRAKALLASLDTAGRERMSALIFQAQLRIAAAEGRLSPEIDRMRGDATLVDSFIEDVRQAAIQLDQTGDKENGRRLKRFYYERRLPTDPSAANFLGLAEVMLESGEPADAVRELRRMALVTSPAFGSLKDAGVLLRRFGKRTEGLPFLEEAAKALPWDDDVQRELAVTRNPPPPPPVRTLPQLEVEVAANPEEASLKLAYFRAARAAGRHRLAVSAIQVLRGMRSDSENDIEHPRQLTFLPNLSMPESERAALARDYADSMERLKQPWEAVPIWRAAEAIAPSAASKAAIARLDAAWSLHKENEARRPVIGDELKLDKLVRPMLVAGGAQ